MAAATGCGFSHWRSSAHAGASATGRQRLREMLRTPHLSPRGQDAARGRCYRLRLFTLEIFSARRGQRSLAAAATRNPAHTAPVTTRAGRGPWPLLRAAAFHTGDLQRTQGPAQPGGSGYAKSCAHRTCYHAGRTRPVAAATGCGFSLEIFSARRGQRSRAAAAARNAAHTAPVTARAGRGPWPLLQGAACMAAVRSVVSAGPWRSSVSPRRRRCCPWWWWAIRRRTWRGPVSIPRWPFPRR